MALLDRPLAPVEYGSVRDELSRSAPVGTALFFGSKKLRPAIGGFALGTAALCTQLAISGETLFAMGPFMLRIWCVVNVLLCLALARLALDTKKA